MAPVAGPTNQTANTAPAAALTRPPLEFSNGPAPWAAHNLSMHQARNKWITNTLSLSSSCIYQLES